MSEDWLALGDRVAGTYLGNPFEGVVVDIGFSERGDGRVYTVKADQPINVSKFASMTILRQRISATLSAAGESIDRKGNRDGIMSLRRLA